MTDTPRLLVVDSDDRVVGFEDAWTCHRDLGRLHRAFSVYLFDDDDRLLVQRRAAPKPLWPGHWSNSCCSHPVEDESIEETIARRLAEELGIAAGAVERLEHLFVFRYHARFEPVGLEYESCHVFAGRYGGTVDPDPAEVDGWRFLSRDALDREVAATPYRFTPWFRYGYPLVFGRLADVD